MSKNLTYVLQHSAEVLYSSEGFVRLSELMSTKNSIVNSLLNATKLLLAIFANPKQHFQISFPVYRVSGTNRKTFVMPDIGLQAVQGHSTRSDVGLEYLIATQ